MALSPSRSAPFDHDFAQQPWCVALNNDPTWKTVPSFSFGPFPKDSTLCSLISDSLKNARGIRAMRTYLRRAPTCGDDDDDDALSPPPAATKQEVRMLFSLGDGVCGIADTCHGGLIGLMLDEATGQLAAEVFGRHCIITAALNVSYKRRLPTPAVVVCRAWLAVEQHPRKIRARGSVENGEGVVFATGEALFIRIDAKM